MNSRLVCDPNGPSGRIVATIGPPDSPAYADLELMLGFGTIRINLAFAGPHNYDEYAALIRRIRERGGDGICIMLDCVGPRVKLGPLPREGIELVVGEEMTITTREVEAERGLVPTVFDVLPSMVKPGEPVLMAEGRMRADVLETDGKTDVRCRIVRGGVLKKRGLNLPDTDLPVPALSERDRRDLAALVTGDVDMVALSFVRGPADIDMLREFLAQQGHPDTRIMAKIETRPAVEAIDDVAGCCDALMVARGDLWAELENPWTLPRVTNRIIRAGNERGIPVITATQTLSSMTDRDVPSRAEVDELYYLLREGTDAIMGSEEFAIGKHPRAVISAIRSVSAEVDRERAERLHAARSPAYELPSFDREQAAVTWAERTDRVRCVVAISNYGPNALRIYRRRPRKPLVVITNQASTARYLQLFGVYCVWVDYKWEDEDHRAIAHAGLQALGWSAGADETAVLVVNHRLDGREYSKIEEIPLTLG
jgi:pyruvate kinase